MATGVNGLRTVFWCRLVFDEWGVSSPEEMANYKSSRSAFENSRSRIDEIFELYEGTNKQGVAFEFLHENNNLKKWQEYFTGKRSPNAKFVNDVDKLVSGSGFFFNYGAQSLFNVMSAKSPEEALEFFKEELLVNVEKSDGSNFYRTVLLGQLLDGKLQHENELIPIKEEEIENLQSNDWVNEYRKLRTFLPNIDAFYTSFPKAEIDYLYTHIAYEVISARFLTDENKYHNLALILFARHGVNAIESFKLEMGIPSSLWLDIPFIKEAFDWYMSYLINAN